ncbi:GDP-mannose 4,6-dehydratase [Mariniflexile soesokkakense]|uniref:GDP-mannose 4,6-dehydratase n=1 Tax=Mariniflexile soesokkakense TaxID=1343160 RepID=A0ABV0AE52_9FLAO
MELHSNKVLITGINGFTGKYLKQYLEQKNYTVHGVSNQVNENEINVYQCDITNKEQLVSIFKKIQPNYIIHLAAISFVQHLDIEEIYKVNVIGTQNLLEASLEIEKKVKKIIIASSAAVYGNQNHSVLNEGLCPNPVNHYGISKLSMEFITKTYFEKLPLIITRPFNYTAPGHGEQFVIPKIAKAFINKEECLELGNLDVYREYNSIYFVCDIYFKLMESNSKSEIVNIASGKTHSLNEVISLFEKETNHKINIKINQSFVRKNEIKKLAGDTKKLLQLIQTPSNSSIDDVIKSFL